MTPRSHALGVPLLAASLAFAAPMSAVAAYADATAALELSVQYTGALALLRRGNLGSGLEVLTGSGTHDKDTLSAGGTTDARGLWSRSITALASAQSEPLSPSVADASYRNALGTIFLVANPVGGQPERIELDFSASATLSTHASGRAEASATADYLIHANHLGLGLPGATFRPSAPLASSAPPVGAILDATHTQRWQFYLAPGDQVVVNLRAARVDAHASAVPSPAPWLLALAPLPWLWRRRTPRTSAGEGAAAPMR